MIVRNDLGDLRDQRDYRDSYRAIDPHDERWVPLREVARVAGKAEATLASGIRYGTYVGEMAWYADDDRAAPGTSLVVP